MAQNGLPGYRTLEERIPQGHPPRRMRALFDEALRGAEPLLAGLYSDFGRPSIALERLLRAMLPQVLYGIPSERKSMDSIEFNLAHRWFVGLELDAEP